MIFKSQEAFKTEQFLNRKTETLIPIGVDFNGDFIFEDLKDLKSIVMVGMTGSGKSIFNHCLINSLLKQRGVKSLFLADCKRVELSVYQDLDCLFGKIYGKTENIRQQLEFLETELELRFLKTKNKMNLDFNDSKIVLVIEEFSDIMVTGDNYFNKTLAKIAQEGPDLNIFPIICTSRPSIGIITKEIRESFNTKIAFTTVNEVDSKSIGITGAEKLSMNGDMLFKKRNEAIKRLQGFYINDKEIGQNIKQ